ncbi:MAG: hypothetical protein M1820_006637 [Bogoriella megaspora]|nr:MAG: hypothetical protein M1820_006637 [Bogoriella megaspora]
MSPDIDGILSASEDKLHTSSIILDLLKNDSALPWKSLADAAREGNCQIHNLTLQQLMRIDSWRSPFGQSGLLNYSLNVLLSPGASSEERVQLLRFVGNCCIDNSESTGKQAFSIYVNPPSLDKNRQILIDGDALGNLGKLLQNADLAPLASAVLFNALNDYEPAQRAAGLSMVHKACIKTITGDSLREDDGSLDEMCQVLAMVASAPHFDDIVSQDDSVSEDATSLLKYIAEVSTLGEDIDHCFSVLRSCLTFMRQESLLKHVVGDHIEQALRVVEYISTLSESPGADKLDEDQKADANAIEVELLDILARTASVVDPSVLLTSGDIVRVKLQDWLTAGEHDVPNSRFVCACLVLGNLAREDDICQDMVLQKSLHHPLIHRLRTSSDSDILAAAGGFLRSLAKPQNNKEVIAHAGGFEAIKHLLLFPVVPNLPYFGACIARQLVNGPLPNIENLLQNTEPLFLCGEEERLDHSYFAELLRCSTKSDNPNVKAETCRTIAAVCRTLNSSHVSEQRVKQIQSKVYQHSQIMTPIKFALTQSQSPVLRSEALLALGLIAKNEEGGNIVVKALVDEEMFNVLKELIIKQEAADETGIEGRLRDNALFVVVTSLKNHGDFIASETQQEIEQLLKSNDIEL